MITNEKGEILMDIVTIVSVAAALFGIIFGVIGWTRDTKSETSTEARQDATILSELGYLKAGVEEVKKKLDKQDERYLEVSTRLTAVEASAKQAHKRLDAIESK